ncbi:MAG: hypothetical protein H7296_07485 [Bacteroidia bacterium]|nr:hypothetical protein [Bacteroidia bacterium]
MDTVNKINKNTRVIHTDATVYAVTLASSHPDLMDTFYSDNKTNWEFYPNVVAGKKIVAYGVNNNLPQIIRNIMDANNLAPGILEREVGLLYGNGPHLYANKFDGGEILREYTYDDAIWNWLLSWDYRKFIHTAMVEYKYLKGFFCKRYLNRATRLGQPAKIVKLKVIPNTDARFAWPESGNSLEDVKEILVGDFEHSCLKTGVTAYPVYQKYNPAKFPVSMSYHNSYSFGRNFYSVPAYYGALSWLDRSNDIADILKYLTEQGLASAFHIHSPAGYWEQKRRKLEEVHQSETSLEIANRLNTLKDLTFENITKVLTGKKNTGKMLETVDFYDDNNNLCAWKIEPIQNSNKDFIESQIKISDKADSATTSGMQLHPSLSNVIINGALSSGSTMLYAHKLYLLSDVAIPEEVIFEPINEAIKVNFPGSNLKLGFYRPAPVPEAQVPPKDRVKNN